MKGLFLALVAVVGLAGGLALASFGSDFVGDAEASLVNIHIHGTNLGRTQVHIHHVVHNVQILDDGTLSFEIDN